MGELTLPLTNSFLMSFEGLHVLEAGKPVVGIREIGVNLEMKGKGVVDVGGSRKPAGWIPGTPYYEVTIKWELTWWTEYMRAHPRYVDEILSRTFAWLTRAREHELSLSGLSFMKQDQQATKGHDGALELNTTWGALDCSQTVDGTPIPMFLDGTL